MDKSRLPAGLFNQRLDLTSKVLLRGGRKSLCRTKDLSLGTFHVRWMLSNCPPIEDKIMKRNEPHLGTFVPREVWIYLKAEEASRVHNLQAFPTYATWCGHMPWTPRFGLIFPYQENNGKTIGAPARCRPCSCCSDSIPSRSMESHQILPPKRRRGEGRDFYLVYITRVHKEKWKKFEIKMVFVCRSSLSTLPLSWI